MKITPSAHRISPLLPQSSHPPSTAPDLPRRSLLHKKPPRRRANARLRVKDPSAKRAAPPTPLLRWKFDEVDEEKEEEPHTAGGDEAAAAAGARRLRKGGGGTVSVRKLAAALWRTQTPEVGGDSRKHRRSIKEADQLGLKQRGNAGVVREPPHDHRGRGFVFKAKAQPRSPCSVNGPVNGYACEPQGSFKFSNYAMEGTTKWDPVCPEKNEDPSSFQRLEPKQNVTPMVSALESELEQARKRIEELESERRSSKKKLKQFLLKLSEERSAWRSRENDKIRAITNDIKADLIRERKNCQRLEIVNSKLVNELTEAKTAMKKYMQESERERKNRELVEEVCDELAKEIGEEKAEVEALKTECMKIREEVDDERKMLQMAEVWREERVQMKLIDAKVTLEDKYAQMEELVVYLQQFLRSKSGALSSNEIREADLLQQAAASVEIQDIREFTYEPPKSDDIFSIFEEMAMGESSERDIEDRENEGAEDDRSGWETVSQADDRGSSFSAEGSVASRRKTGCRYSNASGSGTEYGGGGTPTTEISEVSSMQSRKASSISRLWRSYPNNNNNNGGNYKVASVDGRLSNGGSKEEGLDMAVGWSSPEARGRKGCMEWRRGEKQSLKAKLMEARVESQKVQLRQVLNHRGP